MELLERDAPRAVMDEIFRSVSGNTGAVETSPAGAVKVSPAGAVEANPAGAIVLVSGEAGIGKTAFVSEFAAAQRQHARVWWGGCDPLITPRPLGPVYDIAVNNLPHLLERLNAGADWFAVAAALHKTLVESPSPTIVVLEDVHWADEATLDLIKYLGRRVHQARALFILTYREDEVETKHPLRVALGELPGQYTTRLRLGPLSERAVEAIARRMRRSARGVYAATQGNPFFVTEVLRSQQAGGGGTTVATKVAGATGVAGASSPNPEREEGDIPATVRDAVLARAAHLDAPSRALLETASIVPGPAELWLLDLLLRPDPSTIDTCVERGFLLPAGEAVTFRHELARLAIEESLPAHRARELHQQALTALKQRPGQEVSLARLVHHAARAEDAESVLEYGPRAAEQASRLGAHREAARYYEAAVPYMRRLPVENQAALLDALSFEYYLTGQIDRAVRVRHEAVDLWQKAGQMEQVGDGQRWLSRLYWFQGTKDMADRYAVEAVRTLEQLPPGKALAMAYSTRSQLYMLAEENDAAIEWGEKALALASALQETEITVHALTNIGTAELIDGSEAGRVKLEQALRLAQQHEMHDHISRCFVNLTSRLVENRMYRLAEGYLNEGLAYTSDRDLYSYSVYLLGIQARFFFEQGHWAEAQAAAEEVQRLHPGSAIIALPGITYMGYLLARQGSPEAWRWLDRARDLALPVREFQRTGPVAIARAEAAWWEGKPERVLAELQPALELAGPGQEPYRLGAIAYWMWRAGGEAVHGWESKIPEAYRAMMRGDWRAAAEEWQRIGCPFERALALAAGGVEAQREALGIFEKLGARPAEKWLRDQLVEQGVKGLPRGARASTQANPQGLTARELEILALLERGLSNAEIARELSISPKTVDHHISAILGKLGARSRFEAAALARQQKIV